MKRKLTKLFITAAFILTFAICLTACKKKGAPDPAETQTPAVLEDEGDVVIEVPDDQDTFGE